jgi:hypothetical protein
MGVKTTVVQIEVVGGGLYDQANNILVAERNSPLARGRGRGNLYAVVELSGPAIGRDVVTRQMIQVMQRAYYGWQGSVTAGLQQAIHEANDLLIDENRTSLPGERRRAGVSCIVLRDDDLFIAQAGPTAIYLLHDGNVTRFPDVSPWLDKFPPEDMEAVPLGERRDFHVDLFHQQASSGDTFLVVDSELACTVGPETWPKLLAKAPANVVLEDLYAAGGGRELSALVVRLAEEAVEPVRIQPEVRAGIRKRPGQEPEPGKKAPASPALAAAALEKPYHEPKPAQARQIEKSLAQPAAPAAEPKSRPEPEAEIVQPFWARAFSARAQLRLDERLRIAAQALLGVVAAVWAGFLSLLKRMMPGQPEAQPSPVSQVSVQKAGQKPSSRPKPRKPAQAQSKPIQKLLVGMAIGIPVIVGIVVLAILIQRDQAQRAEVQALLQQANASWQQAQNNPDPKTARAQLAEAQRLLGQLLERRPEDAAALDLQSKVRAQFDVVNQVRRITWAGELNSYPSDAELSRIVVQGSHVFVLDRRNDTVYHHELDPQLQKALDPATTKTVLVAKGQEVDTVLVGDLVDMAWMPTGPNRQKAGLVILESGGSLLEYDPATKQLVPLRVAGFLTWQFPKLIGSHSGRFYLLDSSANQIYRYDPTPDGYSSAPDEWLKTQVDLSGVVDMAIGDSIYLLYADGALLKFSEGKPDPFDISDWDTPPRAPSAVFARPTDETRWIYVADRGNSRIVQASQEGLFKQQFRSADGQATQGTDPLAGATALFVDEITGSAYVLSGQKLYLLILPMSN